MADTDLVFETHETSQQVYDLLKSKDPDEWATVLIRVRLRPDPDTVGDWGFRRVELRGLSGVTYALMTASRDMLYNTHGRFIGSPLEFEVTVTIQAREADLICAKLSLAPEALGIHKEISEGQQR